MGRLQPVKDGGVVPQDLVGNPGRQFALRPEVPHGLDLAGVVRVAVVGANDKVVLPRESQHVVQVVLESTRLSEESKRKALAANAAALLGL